MTGHDKFLEQVTALLPALRAFGRSLCGDPARADDLVQDTVLKAWTNREQSPFVPLNDYIALVIGLTRDGGDFRELLYGDIAYVAEGVTPAEINQPNYVKVAPVLDNIEFHLHPKNLRARPLE